MFPFQSQSHTPRPKPTPESSVRFNTIKRKIPWDLWDLCEAEPINRGNCVSQNSLNQHITWQKHIQAIGLLWFHFCEKGNVNLFSFRKRKCFCNWSEPIIKTWSIFVISPLTFPYQVPQKYYSYPFLCQQTHLISYLYKYFSQRKSFTKIFTNKQLKNTYFTQFQSINTDFS